MGPYDTWLVAGLSVVQVILAVVLFGVAVTLEMTGGIVLAGVVTDAAFDAGLAFPVESNAVTV